MPPSGLPSSSEPDCNIADVRNPCLFRSVGFICFPCVAMDHRWGCVVVRGKQMWSTSCSA